MKIRRVNESDKAQLLAWANTPEAREASDRGIISAQEHEAWFKRVLEHDGIKCFIATVDGERCGYVRFDENTEGSLNRIVSIFVDAEYRGNGAARWMLDYVIDMQLGGGAILANIKLTNLASIKTFEACGFKKDVYGKWRLAL